MYLKFVSVFKQYVLVCGLNSPFYTGETLPQGQSVNTVISQIVMDSKTQPGGERIEVILYNILWNWYKRSKSASLTVIEKALQWSHNEDIIRDMNNHIK